MCTFERLWHENVLQVKTLEKARWSVAVRIKCKKTASPRSFKANMVAGCVLTYTMKCWLSFYLQVEMVWKCHCPFQWRWWPYRVSMLDSSLCFWLKNLRCWRLCLFCDVHSRHYGIVVKYALNLFLCIVFSTKPFVYIQIPKLIMFPSPASGVMRWTRGQH